MGDYLDRLRVVTESIRETYDGPWGLKASPEDVVREAAEALGHDFGEERDPEDELQLADLGRRLWEWESEQPSPFAEGLASLVEDGLAPGSTVPVDEVSGGGDDEWEIRRAKFVLDLIEGRINTTRRFAAEINLGNDAMQTNDQIADALTVVAGNLRAGSEQGQIRDLNGNAVGWFAVSEKGGDDV